VCVVYPLFTVAFFVIIVVFLSMDLCMNQGVGMTKRLDNETKVRFGKFCIVYKRSLGLRTVGRGPVLTA
jgi:hypothetical protein